MELSEAINILKNQICDCVIPSYCKKCDKKSDCLDDCGFVLAIFVVIQELEKLQKENEELKRRKPHRSIVNRNFI